MKGPLVKLPANGNEAEPEMIEIAGDSKELVKLIALGIFTGGLHVFQHVTGTRPPPPTPEIPTEIMTADDVAAFLGVDRNTVYDYAGRGVIPHQRLGKRILFRRGALLSWLDSCKATATRKG